MIMLMLKKRLCKRCPKFKELRKLQKQGELDQELAQLVIRTLVGVGRYPQALDFAELHPDEESAQIYCRYYEKQVFSKDAARPKDIPCTAFGCNAKAIQKCFAREELGELCPGESFTYRKDRKTGEPLNSPMELLRFFRWELPEIGIFTIFNKNNNAVTPDKSNFNPNLYASYIMSGLHFVTTDDDPPQLSVYVNGVWKQQVPPMKELAGILRTHINRAAPNMWKNGMAAETYKVLLLECPSCTTLKSGEDYINVENALLYIEDGKVKRRKHTPEIYTTRQAPVPYKRKSSCPEFMAYLDSTFRRDEDLIKVVQEASGYVLCNNCKTEEMCYLIGQGSNGKSVFLGVLESILGGPKGTCGLSLSQLNKNSFARIKLLGKFANLSNESEAQGKDPISLEISRQIASGNSIWVEDKGKSGFMTKITAKQFYSMTKSFRSKTPRQGATFAESCPYPSSRCFLLILARANCQKT